MSNVRIFTRINKSRQVTPSLPLSSEEQLPVINPNPTGQAIRHNSTLDKNGGDSDNDYYGHNTEDIQEALEGSNLPTAINVFATMDDVGGGADSNAVHYNAADGKTAIEKLQARVNIGSTSSTPQLIATAGAINDLAITSNHLVFTGASVVLSGIVAGLNGEEVTILNASGTSLTLLSESVISAANNRFNSAVIVPNLSILRIKYRTTSNRYFLENIGVNDGRYVRKDIADTKTGSLAINYNEGLGATSPIRINNNSTSGNDRGLELYDNAGNLKVTLKGGFSQFNQPIVLEGLIANGVRFFRINSLDSNTGAGSFAQYDLQGIMSMRFDKTGQITHSRSGSAIFSIRRDEQRLHYLLTINTAGAINDQALTDGIFNYRFTAATSISGFDGGEIGRTIDVDNDTGSALTLIHQGALSIAANRIKLIGGTDLVIPIDGKATLKYCTGSRYELISTSFKNDLNDSPNEETISSGSSTVLLDINTYRFHNILLESNGTVNLTGITTGKYLETTLRFKQDATGSRTIIWAVSGLGIIWQNGDTPNISASANWEVIVKLSYDGGASGRLNGYVVGAFG